MIYAFICRRCGDLPVATCCRVMGVSTSRFYGCQPGPVSRRDWDDAILRDPRLGPGSPLILLTIVFELCRKAFTLRAPLTVPPSGRPPVTVTVRFLPFLRPTRILPFPQSPGTTDDGAASLAPLAEGKGMGSETREGSATVARPQPRLRGRGVLLRLATDDDVVPLWEATVASKAELIPWLAWCHDEYSLEETTQWLALCREGWDARELFYFVVTDEASGRMIGACGVNQVDWPNRRANLGYWVRTGAHGRGVATESAWLLARYGLEGLGLTRLEIVVACAASERVAVKVGATREGVLRKRLWSGGCSHDAVSYSLTSEDLPRLRR